MHRPNLFVSRPDRKLLHRSFARGPIVLVSTLCALCFLPSTARAKPPGQKLFCDAYPQAPACKTGSAACTTCHSSPPALNLFGGALAQKLAPDAARPLSDEAYSAGLPEALRAVDVLDTDGDGVANGDETRAGTDPANADSTPATRPCTSEPKTGWNLCGYDNAYVLRKIYLDFCGRSSIYEERAAFAQVPDPKAALHAALNTCLKSEFWQGRNGEVWKLASPKIRPIQSIKGGQDAGPVPLADYYRDYALFVYATTGERDARDLLQAQYLVEASKTKPTTYSKLTRSAYEDFLANNEDVTATETVDTKQRAGMITSSWFRAINTMFTAIPRTTAAQAYRSYLGLDIALLQGLTKTAASEPVDYDSKGVRAPGCITCHATLDPLAYPFSRYEALDNDTKSFTSEAYFSAYRKDRMTRFVEAGEGADLANTPQAGYLLGKPVSNLVEWGALAANSDEFAQKTVLDFWQLLLGSDPKPTELAQYTALWKRFRNENAYQVEKMLNDLIDTEAYGAP